MNHNCYCTCPYCVGDEEHGDVYMCEQSKIKELQAEVEKLREERDIAARDATNLELHLKLDESSGTDARDSSGEVGRQTARADALQAEVERLREERDGLQQTFDVCYKANMRGIKAWQEKTGRDMEWPDHAKLVEWLLDQLDEARKVGKDLYREVIAMQINYDDSHGLEPHINGVALVHELDHPWLEDE